MNDRDFYDALCEDIARRGRKKPRRRRMKVTKLPDDPRIARKAKAAFQRAAQRQPMRGDRIGESEDAIWLNAARAAEIVLPPKKRKELGR